MQAAFRCSTGNCRFDEMRARCLGKRSDLAPRAQRAVDLYQEHLRTKTKNPVLIGEPGLNLPGILLLFLLQVALLEPVSEN